MYVETVPETKDNWDMASKSIILQSVVRLNAAKSVFRGFVDCVEYVCEMAPIHFIEGFDT